MIAKNLISFFEDSFKKHWDLPAMSNYEGQAYTYGQMTEAIDEWHQFFRLQGLQRGDKVALMGKDSAEWAIFFIAVITYGAVIVPILQDFPPADAMQIIDHSESKLLAINANLWSNMRLEGIPLVSTILDFQEGHILHGTPEAIQQFADAKANHKAQYPTGMRPEDVSYYHTPNEELLVLNYTSGTTGFSKGVMLSGNNFAGNLTFCIERSIIRAKETLLCFLPMAHVYSCMINLFLAMASGTHVVVLGKIPSPKILGVAFKKVRPTVIISVPLVLEKIYQNTLQPILKSRKVRFMLSLPILRNVVYRKIREQLSEGLGGDFRQVIVGGAALNPEVGEFLKRIGFPITVGYGMTECAPLISFIEAEEWRLRSCGRVLEPYMEARIAPLNDEQTPSDTASEIGEIQVRGENVCMGYYKNPEQTAALFTEDGWMRTGDLGTMDSDHFLYIRGRSKAMLLGSNGQNIYPEELEAKIGMLPYVQESLVLMRDGKLEALIVPNMQLIEQAGITLDEAWEAIQSQRAALNEQVGSYEKIQRFELRTEPFEKTPKQSIRRYLYK
ncbi:MAG: AMP-binding protein [Porphyromonadaceae bacterium]|nr:AMP-binding protein [Porphyromonadaceae bacterium]